MSKVASAPLKDVWFCGDSLDALKRFPVLARKDAGHQLDSIQQGEEPEDWKPMNTVGVGVREIRIRDEQGIFRVMYVTKFHGVIYVLHCFQKKTQQTSEADIELGRKRYKEIVREGVR